MSSKRCDPSRVWTDEERARAAERIREEMTRKAVNATTVAARVGVAQRTVERAMNSPELTAPATMVRIGDALNIPRDEILPPRDPDEQAQLDRIEAMLIELLTLLRPAVGPSDVAAVVQAQAARTAKRPPEDRPTPTRKPRRGREA